MSFYGAEIRPKLFDGQLDGAIQTNASCSSESERWRWIDDNRVGVTGRYHRPSATTAVGCLPATLFCRPFLSGPDHATARSSGKWPERPISLQRELRFALVEPLRCFLGTWCSGSERFQISSRQVNERRNWREWDRRQTLAIRLRADRDWPIADTHVGLQFGECSRSSCENVRGVLDRR